MRVRPVPARAEPFDKLRLGSAEGRADIYRLALRIGFENPVTGVGLGAYPYANEQYAFNNPDVVAQSQGLIDTHSTYLNVFAETGVTGLLLYLTMMASVLLHAARVRRELVKTDARAAARLGLISAGYVAFMVSAIVGTYTNTILVYVHLCTVWAFAEVYNPRRIPRKTRRKEHGLFRKTGVAEATCDLISNRTPQSQDPAEG